MRAKSKGFKRINFFKGFPPPGDWNDAERYHIEKRRLQQDDARARRGLASAAISRSRRVPRGDLSVEIQPGYAVDGQGPIRCCGTPEIKTLVLEEVQAAADHLHRPALLRTGNRLYRLQRKTRPTRGIGGFWKAARSKFRRRCPDIREEVELARILLDKMRREFVMPVIRMSPKANEIDLRFVPRAGVAGASMDPVLKIRLALLLERLRRLLGDGARQQSRDRARCAGGRDCGADAACVGPARQPQWA